MSWTKIRPAVHVLNGKSALTKKAHIELAVIASFQQNSLELCFLGGSSSSQRPKCNCFQAVQWFATQEHKKANIVKLSWWEFRPENDQPLRDDGICVCHGPSGHVIRPVIGHVLGGLGLHLFHGEAAAEPSHLHLLDEHCHLAAQITNLFLQFGVLS